MISLKKLDSQPKNIEKDNTADAKAAPGQSKMNKNAKEQIINFCNIQLQILADREERIRKDLLDCKIQKEFLSSLLGDLYDSQASLTNKRNDE